MDHVVKRVMHYHIILLPLRHSIVWLMHYHKCSSRNIAVYRSYSSMPNIQGTSVWSYMVDGGRKKFSDCA